MTTFKITVKNQQGDVIFDTRKFSEEFTVNLKKDNLDSLAWGLFNAMREGGWEELEPSREAFEHWVQGTTPLNGETSSFQWLLGCSAVENAIQGKFRLRTQCAELFNNPFIFTQMQSEQVQCHFQVFDQYVEARHTGFKLIKRAKTIGRDGSISIHGEDLAIWHMTWIVRLDRPASIASLFLGFEERWELTCEMEMSQEEQMRVLLEQGWRYN